MNPFENYHPYDNPGDRWFNVQGQKIWTILQNKTTRNAFVRFYNDTVGGVLEVVFRVGSDGFPAAGATTIDFLDGTGTSVLKGRKADLYRNGLLQSRGDSELGFSQDPDTGMIQVVPALTDRERIILKIFAPNQDMSSVTDVSLAPPPVVNTGVFSLVFDSIFK